MAQFCNDAHGTATLGNPGKHEEKQQADQVWKKEDKQERNGSRT
jgi:hypothetical protein